ncbi:uncharacterized protein J3D65DRAFT_602036 [Phyllosticta citribraziliensis]|uniref:Uncharacterized protein n=1 Tax=Phyllosticta citribraziliensis TaxID=989973 RepID=A0ABR1LZT7_9PEZI
MWRTLTCRDRYTAVPLSPSLIITLPTSTVVMTHAFRPSNNRCGTDATTTNLDDRFQRICQWAALNEVDVRVVGEKQLEQLVTELRVKNKTAKKLVKRCMRLLAGSLGWIVAGTTELKPASQRVWPLWTKGWLRSDWNGSIDEPGDSEKQRIARWWAIIQDGFVEGGGGGEEDSDAVSDVDAAEMSTKADNNSCGKNDQDILDTLLEYLYPGNEDEKSLVMETLLGPGGGRRRYEWLL